MEKFALLTSVLSSEAEESLKKILENPYPRTEIQTFRGRKIIPDFNAATMEYIHNKWNAKSGDVFIASYPKTGSHWITEIVHQILYRHNQDWLDMSRYFPMALRFLENGQAEKFSVIDSFPISQRIFQTHMTPEMINFEKIKKANTKVIYVYRNPKDAIVSWLKFIKILPLGKMEPFHSMISNGWSNYVDNVVSGNFHMNLKPGEWYPDHILSWYPHRDEKTVCFVAYEDLKKDLLTEIKKLSEFLEAPVDDEFAEKIAESCDIASMKDMARKSNPAYQLIYRKGEVGGWKDYFTVSQSERIDAIMDEKLKHTDIKFTYALLPNQKSKF